MNHLSTGVTIMDTQTYNLLPKHQRKIWAGKYYAWININDHFTWRLVEFKQRQTLTKRAINYLCRKK